MDKLILTMELPTSINHLYGRNKFGSVYMKKEGKLYKEKMIKMIQEEVKKQNWIKAEVDVFVFMDEVIYMNTKGRDSDNLKKLLQDSITESEVVWHDDTFCLPKTNRIYIDKDNPRVEIILTKADFIGVFENTEQYNKFLKYNCNVCKRGKNGNCSIHRKAIENRIQKEINIYELTCTRKKEDL